MAMLDDLAALFPDEVTIQAGTFDAMGAFTAAGGAVVAKAHCYGKIRQVRDEAGELRVSTVTAVLKGVFGATVRHRYTLPARFVPNQPRAIAVKHATDENGPHHETVLFE